MDALMQDIRFALRHMAKHTSLTGVIVVSLGLGIGVNTGIFGLIRALILSELPVAEPGRLVLLHWGADAYPKGLSQSSAGAPRDAAWRNTSRSFAYPFYEQIAKDKTLFSSVFAFAPLGPARESTTLAARGSGERVDAEMVSGSFFSGLGITAAAGRLISPADEQDEARVAVISHAYWVRRFAADPGIVGNTITINSVPYTVIGIARTGFFGVQPGRMPAVWIPITDAAPITPWGYRPANTPSLRSVRDHWWVRVMARLQTGVDARQVPAMLDAAFQRFVFDALPGVERQRAPHIGVEPGGAGLDRVRQTYERPLYVLMGVVGVVLAIACANVSVLLLAASTSRRREFALRVSCGAGRSRLVRQLLTESLMLAAAGGLLGVLLAGWTSRGLLFLLPWDQRPLVENPIDPGMLVFAAAVSVATALLFGSVPALVGTRMDLLPLLRQSASGSLATELPGHRLWSSALVIAQIALSLVLLAGAALFVRTVNHMYAQPLGVDRERLLVFGLDASQNGYAGGGLAAVYSDILQRLQAMPGVEAASATRLRLFSGWTDNGPISIPEDQPKEAGMILFSNGVGADFARTTGIRVLAGRDMTWGDVHGARRVALVNEAMASYFFGEANPIGRRFRFETGERLEYEVIGVASNAKYSGVDGRFPRTAYVPYTANRTPLGGLYMMVRGSGDPLTLATATREAIRSVDPNIDIIELDSLNHHIDGALWRERLFARLTSMFSLLALTLACIGLYGTIAYGVGRRRAEFAVRIALGALRARILWMVLRGALVMAGAGVAVGIPITLWSGRFLASQLAGVTPHDPAALAASALVLIVVTGLAGYVPARRATLIEPAAALKQE